MKIKSVNSFNNLSPNTKDPKPIQDTSCTHSTNSNHKIEQNNLDLKNDDKNNKKIFFRKIRKFRKILLKEKKNEKRFVCIFPGCNHSYPTFYKWSTHHRTHVRLLYTLKIFINFIIFLD